MLGMDCSNPSITMQGVEKDWTFTPNSKFHVFNISLISSVQLSCYKIYLQCVSVILKCIYGMTSTLSFITFNCFERTTT